MRILLAGGSGLIGRAVEREARRRGDEVGHLVRRDPAGPRQWRWDPGGHRLPDEAIGWADGVVNLAGAPIGRIPWTRRYGAVLLQSRLDATSTIAAAIDRCDRPPSVLVSGSAVGYYGDRPGEQLDERSDPGTGFLAGLCQRWEGAAALRLASTRVATIRTGLVLGPGGALAPLMLATRLGGGARIGSGSQIWPWIALDDTAGAILHVLHTSVSGPVNLVAPATATSEDVTTTLAEVMGRPQLLALPPWLLRLPLGPLADEMLLLTQRIDPAVLTATGYRFTVSELRTAIERAVHGV